MGCTVRKSIILSLPPILFVGCLFRWGKRQWEVGRQFWLWENFWARKAYTQARNKETSQIYGLYILWIRQGVFFFFNSISHATDYSKSRNNFTNNTLSLERSKNSSCLNLTVLSWRANSTHPTHEIQQRGSDGWMRLHRVMHHQNGRLWNTFTAKVKKRKRCRSYGFNRNGGVRRRCRRRPSVLTDVHDAVFLRVEEEPVVEQGQFGVGSSDVRLHRGFK